MAHDTTLPILDSISVSDSKIDRTTGDSSITVSLIASDADSGVASITVVLLDPNGGTYSQTLEAATGDLVFEITSDMPEGDYSFQSVTVTDNEGNERVYDGPNLSSMFENNLSVTDEVEDVTPPQLVDFEILDPVIAKGDGDLEMTVRIELSDDISGVNYLGLYIYSSDGRYEGVAQGFSVTEDGLYTLKVPELFENGDYEIKIYTVDNADNNTWITADDIALAGFDPSFEVTGDEDVTPPEIVNYSIVDPVVDMSAGDQEITFDLDVSDDMSGLKYGYLRIQSPSGKYQYQYFYSEENSLTFNVPDYFDNGEYKVSVYLWDNAANSDYLYYTKLDEMGLESTFTVTGADPDMAYPTLDAFKITNVEKNAEGDTLVTFNVAVSEDHSGVDYLRIKLVSPTGQDVYSYIQDANSGTATITIPEEYSNGEYEVSLYVRDNAQNNYTYSYADLIEMGFDVNFAVADSEVVEDPAPEPVPEEDDTSTDEDEPSDEESGEETGEEDGSGDEKTDKGHGNNEDGQDDDNPGKGKGGPNAEEKDGEDEDEKEKGPGTDTKSDDEPHEETEEEPEEEDDTSTDDAGHADADDSDSVNDKGHGNNEDGQDDDNPGQGSGGPNAAEKDGDDEDEGTKGQGKKDKGSDDDDLIEGEDADDTLAGGAGDDTISAGGGDDEVWAGADDEGDDVYVGGGGKDKIGGGNGNDLIIGDNLDGITGDADGDKLFGGNGNDTLVSGSWDDANGDGVFQIEEAVETEGGTDTVWAGNGDDLIISSSGDDALGGGEGDDEIIAGDGSDTVYGGYGDGDGEGVNDVIDGGNGADKIFAGVGNDVVLGGNGDDTLFSGQGDDTVDGGNGEDVIYMGPGDDVFAGGGGADTFYFKDEGGDDVVTDFDVEEDILVLTGVSSLSSDTDVATYASAATLDGDDGLLLDFGEGTTIFLEGVDIDDLASMNIVL